MTGRMSNRWLMVVLVPLLFACTTISPFNEYAYQQATSIKVDALALIAKSEEPYSSHESEVDALESRCLKAYEYARGLPKNEDTADQWQVITDPNSGSLFSYFELWKSEGKVSVTEAKDAKTELAKHFDQIIELESGKAKSK